MDAYSIGNGAGESGGPSDTAVERLCNRQVCERFGLRDCPFCHVEPRAEVRWCDAEGAFEDEAGPEELLSRSWDRPVLVFVGCYRCGTSFPADRGEVWDVFWGADRPPQEASDMLARFWNGEGGVAGGTGNGTAAAS